MFEAMGTGDAVRLIRHVDAVRRAPSDRNSIQLAIGEITRLRAWLDGCETELAAAIVVRSPLPTRDLAAAGRISERAANKVIERADTASSIPELADAMASGDISGGHVDAVTAGVKSLPPSQRAALRKRAGELAAKASSSTVDEFRSTIQAEARRIMEDDGMARLERQKRACRLRTWTSNSDGMWRISGTFDPETGLRLSGRLDNAVATLFAESTPDTAPDDPGERADYLRALALAALTEGRAGSSGRAEIIAVLHEYQPTDQRAPDGEPPLAGQSPDGTDSAATHAARPTGEHANDGSTPTGRGSDARGDGAAGTNGNSNGNGNGNEESRHRRADETRGEPPSGPHVDWGVPVELPWDALTRLMNSSATEVFGVVVRNGIVVHAPGQLDLGRTTRLASNAQRRALRAMYSTCAVPGCCVRFQYTNAHHVVWWERGGTTDIGNLLPLCSRHHHLAHEGGWHLHLDDQRQLTITLPDGTKMTNAPPRHHRKAA